MQYWGIFNQADDSMILIAIAHIIVIFSLSYLCWKKSELSYRRFFWPALLFKLLAGVSLGLLYTYYYTIGDTFQYFNDGTLLAKLAKEDLGAYLKFLWFDYQQEAIGQQLSLIAPRAIFFSKIVSIFVLIAGRNYWIIASYFSLFSFLACWTLVMQLNKYFTGSLIPAVISFLFFPSVVFWTSGVIKESLAFTALLIIIVLFLKVWFRGKILMQEVFFGGLFLWLLWSLKYYFGGILIAVISTSLLYKYLLCRILKPVSGAGAIVIWLATLVVPLFLVSLLHPNFYPSTFLEMIVENYEAFQAVSEPSDVIHYYNLEPSLASIIINLPWALTSGLFRPFIFEASNILQTGIALENLFLTAAFLLSLKHIRQVAASKYAVLIVAALTYAIWLCIFITLSTPNFGTLVRYRVGYLPFFCFIILLQNPVNAFLQRLISRLVR